MLFLKDAKRLLFFGFDEAGVRRGAPHPQLQLQLQLQLGPGDRRKPSTAASSAVGD